MLCRALRAGAADGARARMESGGGARLLDGETWAQALRVDEARGAAEAGAVEAAGREALRRMMDEIG